MIQFVAYAACMPAAFPTASRPTSDWNQQSEALAVIAYHVHGARWSSPRRLSVRQQFFVPAVLCIFHLDLITFTTDSVVSASVQGFQQSFHRSRLQCTILYHVKRSTFNPSELDTLLQRRVKGDRATQRDTERNPGLRFCFIHSIGSSIHHPNEISSALPRSSLGEQTQSAHPAEYKVTPDTSAKLLSSLIKYCGQCARIA